MLCLRLLCLQKRIYFKEKNLKFKKGKFLYKNSYKDWNYEIKLKRNENLDLRVAEK